MSELFNPPFIIAILIALTVHEWAHAYVADRLGDPTPRSEGRLTMNPIAHLDPIGTIMFFLVHFGWGKPVPINPRYFKNMRKGSALVAVAGPLSNLILAFVAFFLLVAFAPQVLHVSSSEELMMTLGFGERLQAFLSQVLANSLFINLGLMAFNLLPIAPLDGSKIVQAFIPLRYEYSFERYMEQGPYILIGILLVERLLKIPILLTWITVIVDAVLSVMTAFL